jgi:hypothetical protein
VWALSLIALAGAGALATAQPQPLPSIVLTKTVGTDPATCAASDAITLVGGGNATYCFVLMNSGGLTLSVHDLVDSQLGTILQDFIYPLAPGASTFVTRTALVTSTTVNTATWAAADSLTPTIVVTTTDIATATVIPAQPSIVLTKTVGTDSAVCAATDVITLLGGGEVTYCYTVLNTGNVTLSLHDLVDTQLGAILQGFAYALAPGASAFVTETTLITGTTVNFADWTASDQVSPTVVISTSDVATATVVPAQPSIVLTKTVGTDPTVCAGTGMITIVNQYQANVYYCYQVLNTGDITLTVHDLVDSELGTLLAAFPYSLGPGASYFVTQSATLTETTANTATWTAGLAGIASATADGEATVDFQSIIIPVLSRTGIALLLLLVAAAGLVLLRRLS